MLSFDITDRNIRIIKGTESGGKIKITAAAELELDESLIVNGHVNDINRVVGRINRALKDANIADKEAVISISSNQTVFKELMIPPNPKETEFMKSVRLELKNQINIDDSYSVAYVIVGDPEDDENGGKVQRILATACPQDVVQSYRQIFSRLEIRLNSVMIGCNAITKVLLADAKTKAKMPLLAVQVDANFISLNLYENGVLSFSRFASIDPEDYDHPDDYIYEAVNENIFRMLQFARIRGSEEIRNVVFYGDIDVQPDLYDRLDKDLKSNDLEISRLNIPPQIHGYQNLNFSLYANAIGTMFKRDKLTEHINLLETDASGGGVNAKVPQDDHSFNLMAGIGIVASVAVVGVVFGILFASDMSYKNKTKDLRATLDSPETAAKLQQYDDLQVMKDKVRAYADDITKANDAYGSLPVLEEGIYTGIDEAIEAVYAESEGIDDTPVCTAINFEDGMIEVTIEYHTTEEFSQKYPATFVQYLDDTYGDYFDAINYKGYDLATLALSDGSGEVRQVTFTLELYLSPDKRVEVVEETVPEEDAGDDAAAEE